MTEIISLVSCIFSAIAVLVSIITWIKTNKNSKIIAEKTLNTKFFEKIFFDNIIIKLPEALAKIHNDEGNKEDLCYEATNIIYDILEKSQFYKYFDAEFYGKILKILVELDEKIISMTEKNIDKYVMNKEKEEISKLTDKFYSELRLYYSKI